MVQWRRLDLAAWLWLLCVPGVEVDFSVRVEVGTIIHRVSFCSDIELDNDRAYYIEGLGYKMHNFNHHSSFNCHMIPSKAPIKVGSVVAVAPFHVVHSSTPNM
jgi:hypothetical protein